MHQLPDGQHELDKYVEIGENYEMLQLIAQLFKKLNTHPGANPIDAMKNIQKKSKSCT